MTRQSLYGHQVDEFECSTMIYEKQVVKKLQNGHPYDIEMMLHGVIDQS